MSEERVMIIYATGDPPTSPHTGAPGACPGARRRKRKRGKNEDMQDEGKGGKRKERRESNTAVSLLWQRANQGQLSDGWLGSVKVFAVLYYGRRQLAFEWERIDVR